MYNGRIIVLGINWPFYWFKIFKKLWLHAWRVILFRCLLISRHVIRANSTLYSSLASLWPYMLATIFKHESNLASLWPYFWATIFSIRAVSLPFEPIFGLPFSTIEQLGFLVILFSGNRIEDWSELAWLANPGFGTTVFSRRAAWIPWFHFFFSPVG